jgi:transcriptional regulator with XRE-family HTH domain
MQYYGCMVILDQIRAAIKASDKSQYRIALDLNIPKSHLSKLMKGERGLSVERLELLAEYLGFEIVLHPLPNKQPEKTKTKG